MGIPKFFRYVSERWPLISQLVNESQVPEFDNLYLDMNSILHTCTHKDSDATHHLTEEEMFVGIFNYIEHLFDLIRPQKVFYMAIDGVAPRAKMNQQRARRFRSALDAENARKKALSDGLTLPTEDPFDSNAITPGTEFMAKLTTQLKYFINRKVSEDSTWQGIDIILSGHEVPGEGEHKIMDFIRVHRARPEYNANTRHCLYGLDADLIMLGLLSHDPHFALLREEVTFGRSQKTKELSEQRFFLLHLSLVREYIELEYRDIEDELSFPYDFERVLDDFILINYFIGNDFLPEVPSLLINTGALPILMAAYKRTLKKTEGYLTEGGTIHFERMGIWLDEIAKFELENFEESAVDVQWMNEELEDVGIKGPHHPKLKLSLKEKELLRALKPFILKVNHDGKVGPTAEVPSTELPDNVTEREVPFLQALAEKTYTRLLHDEGKWKLSLDNDGLPDEEDEEDADTRLVQLNKVFKKYENAPIEKEEQVLEKKVLYNEKFNQWKAGYYKDKFGVKKGEGEELITDVAENYLEGLQWVLYYYYTGCASWSWFYRYHYAPCISDIRKGLKKEIKFNLSSPYRPFEQLMGVLPERSRKLVPQAYWPLMGDELSPIKDFYPRDFELDMNGKKNDWEAVVKIPFVDEKRLLAALATKDELLSDEEKRRNSFGKEIKFAFNPQTDFVYPSSMPGVFLDLPNCHCIEISIEQAPRPEKINFKLMQDVKLGVNALAGFPSMKTIPFTASIEQAGVFVFQQPTRNESMILSLKNNYEGQSAQQLAEELIGEQIFVGWPYLLESKVVAISDDQFRYEKFKGTIVSNPHDGKLLDRWRKQAKGIETSYQRLGTKIGRVSALVHTRKLKGLKRTEQGAYVKEFGGNDDEEQEFAVQTLVEEVVHEDERFKEREPLSLSDEYPVGSQAVYLGPSGFGQPVKIVDHAGDGERMKIEVLQSERKEPAFGQHAAHLQRTHEKYWASYEVARILKMHPLLLSKITAKFLVEADGKKFDVGLCLKSEARRTKVLGYTRKAQRGWEYSSKAVQLIQGYQVQFPQLWAALSVNVQNSNIPQVNKLLNVDVAKARALMTEVRTWIKKYTENSDDFETVSFESDGLAVEAVRKVEQAIISHFAVPAKPASSVTHNNVPRQVLLAPTHAYHQLRSQKFGLGDRVVSALNFGKVKLFERGTVIAVNSETTKVTLAVMFDNEFDAGTTLGDKLKGKRGLTVDAGSVVNLTNKQLVYQTRQQQQRAAAVAAATVQQRGTGNTNNAHGHAKPGHGPSNNVWGGAAKNAPSGPRNSPGPKKSTTAATGAAAHPKQPQQQQQSQGPKPQGQKAQGAAKAKGPVAGQVKIMQKPKEESQPQSTTQKVDQASNDLMAILKGNNTPQEKKEDSKPKKSNEEALASISGKHSKQSQQNLIGAVYGQFIPQQQNFQPPPPPMFYPPPLPPGMVPPPPPPGWHPGMVPPPHGFQPPPPPPPPQQQQQQQYDDAASAALMAQLNIGGSSTGSSQQRGNGNQRGRGGHRGGRGRGGRGKGNSSEPRE